MSIKLSQIESLLTLPHEADIELWSVPIETIKEVSRLYGTKINEHQLNRWTTIRKGSVTLCLNTNPKNT